MESFRFKNKPQTQTYTIYTLIAVVLGVFIFSGLDIYINKEMAYLLVTLLSFLSIMSAIRKASKEFEEIIVLKSDIKFYFRNKLKEPLLISKVKVSAALMSDNTIEFNNEESKKVIGQAHKSKLENQGSWEELIMCFQLKE